MSLWLRWWVLSMLLCLPALVHASIFGSKSSAQPLTVDKAFVLTGGQTGPDQFDLIWQIEPDYYLYQDRIEWTLPEGVVLLDRQDSATEEKDDPLFGRVSVFYTLAEVSFKLARQSEEVPDTGRFALSYQGCWEGGICYPPVQVDLDFASLPLASAVNVAAGLDSTSSPLAPASELETNPPPLSDQDQFFETLSKGSLATLLLAFFVAGLALSLTPCVFPMIPILSGIIAGQGHRVNTRRGLALSTVYVLAMAVTYTLAGVLAGLFGANLQAALQLPWVIVLFSLIFVALALSMFGFYDLQFPSAFQTWLSKGSDRQRGGTYLGVALMGFLSALIVGPCMAAPLAGALIYIGQTGDPVLGGLALFSLSMGMGVPLILIGTSAAKVLPRAGRWMEGVKAGFGVVLLLMAVWMLDRIVPVQVTLALAAIILMVSAVYLGAFEALHERSGGWHKLAKGSGLVLFVYGVLMLIGLLSGGQSILYPLKGFAAGTAQQPQNALNFVTVSTEARLDEILMNAEQNGTPVMLDYYADWCVSCKELEYVTFADLRVQEALQSVQLIKVDVTENNEESKRLNERHTILGPPTLVFYDRAGTYQPRLTLVGVPEPEAVLDNLARL